jgi:molybdopterin converting factor small subunit
MARGTVRYWAAAREAAGLHEEPYDAATLAEALNSSSDRHGDRMATLLARCTFIVDGEAVGRADPTSVQLSDDGSIEVLPPFAGGSSDTMPRWPRS